MSSYDSSWDKDFPPVMQFIDHENAYAKPWNLLMNHPCYDAAKNKEDRAAAFTLAHDLLSTPINQAQLNKIVKIYSNAIIAPVHAMEANGKNRIPEMLADYIGLITRIEVNDNIIQSNKVHRTGSDEWHRFAFRPTFDGPVLPNHNYILVDDVFAYGGSFNELRLHIERNGGKVVQTAVISLGGHGNKIAPEPQLIKSLIDRHGENNLNLFLKEINLYDGNYKALTNPEAFALGRTASLDAARDRILKARQERRTSMGAESFQEIGDKTSTITSVDDEHRRKIRR